MHIIVIGGGTAGWLTALIAKKYGHQVEVVTGGKPSGVGESTTASFKRVMETLDISEGEWMAACNATYKLGVKFVDWYKLDTHYVHPFVDSYGYHLDAILLANFLRGVAESRGVVVHDARARVCYGANTNNIESVVLLPPSIATNQTITQCTSICGDLYICCTGFGENDIRPRSAEPCLYFEDRCNAVTTIQLTADNKIHDNFTEAHALRHGWAWKIPLKNRTSYGYVHNSRYVSKLSAEVELREFIKKDGEECATSIAQYIEFPCFRRTTSWRENTITLGLADGFVEPLEATGIAIVTQQLGRLFEDIYQSIIPVGSSLMRLNYNSFSRNIFTNVNEFVDLHYTLTQRDDTCFWRDIKKRRPSAQTLQRIVNDAGKYHADIFGQRNYEYIIEGMKGPQMQYTYT